MMDSHTTLSVTVWVSWHVDAHKYDLGHMDALGKVHLSPYSENEVKCVLNRLKGSVLAGFDDAPEL